MTMIPSRKAGLRAISAALVFVLAGQAHAQNAGQPAGKPDDAVLKGPEVRDNSVPGQRGKFGGGGGGAGAKGRDQQLPPRVMMQALAVLRQESTPAEARLSSEQEQKLRSVQDELKDQTRRFVEENRDEIVKLRSQLGVENRRRVDERLRGLPGLGGQDRQRGKSDKPLGRPDRKPDAGGEDAMQDGMQEASPAQEQSAMTRLREIAERAPDAKAAQTKAWAVLSDAQKSIVQKEIERLRKDMGQQRKGQPKPGEAPAPGRTDGPVIPPGAIGPDGKVDLSKLPEPMRQRLENLSPQEREKAIKRLLERGGKPGGGGGGDKGGGAGKKRPPGGKEGQKPPPSMDDVDVPAPDQSQRK
ncbi:MAG: hypothetical protein IT435_04575 [Phycisphaerales bacterium]|nr:hypothetical protein [Phycisphaerales bacterium]